jgi:hypothetical protein
MAMRETDLEPEQMYIPREAFTVIDGDQTAERFNNMHRLLNKNRAAQFWGVEEEWAKMHGKFFNAIVPRPNTIDTRLLIIKYALREVPEPDEFTGGLAYKTPAREIITGARRVKTKRISGAVNGKKPVKLGITYGEAHDTPAIRNAAVISLHEVGDPITEVVRSLEGWRRANSSIEITDSQLRQGHETFDVLLLSSEASPYVSQLGKTAVQQTSSVSM